MFFSWTSAQHIRAKMLVFFQDLEGLTEVLGGMTAGASGRKPALFGLIFRF